MQWIIFLAAKVPPLTVDQTILQWFAQLGPAGALVGIAYAMLRVFMAYIATRDEAHRQERKELVAQLAAITEGQGETLREAITVMTRVIGVVDGLKNTMERTERIERAERVRRQQKPGDSEERKSLQ